ncbi:(Fe-S)-binding protein [Porphyromonadaceae bacterium W3.11]|nr:(Fe-S)-binding protein [Porphyromonadaceae bacterium W3.11]
MKIGLFIPCYINAVYPNVGIACYELLKSFGYDVEYPLDQTCCGQPMANGGYEQDSRKLAERFEDLFSDYEYVVGPSASCVAFVRENYSRLLNHECKTEKSLYDITEFLYDIVKPESFPTPFPHKVSVHNSCHGVRELGLSAASELTVPYFNKIRSLLERVPEITVFEPTRIDECCGFGGLYSVEEPEISACMGRDKIGDHMHTGAEFITGADSSCLMHMQGVIDREKLPIQTIHFLEILTGQKI